MRWLGFASLTGDLQVRPCIDTQCFVGCWQNDRDRVSVEHVALAADSHLIAIAGALKRISAWMDRIGLLMLIAVQP